MEQVKQLPKPFPAFTHDLVFDRVQLPYVQEAVDHAADDWTLSTNQADDLSVPVDDTDKDLEKADQAMPEGD
jgi:hypothetical protein